jgi:hypothetical protein
MSRLPETAKPPISESANPRSLCRNHVLVAAGSAGAYPAPRMMRISKSPIPETGVRALAIDQTIMPVSRIFRGPYQSTSGPESKARSYSRLRTHC